MSGCDASCYFLVLWVVILVFVVGIIVGITITLAANDDYRLGQIDAMSGKVAFELKTVGDGSTQWVRIDKEK